MNLSRQFLTATVTLVALYLVVRNASGAASVLSSSARAYSTGVRTLQGR